jgi:hypothetical protein
MRFLRVTPPISVLITFTCCLMWLSCGGGGSALQPAGRSPKLTQISITPANPAIVKGATLQLAAAGIFDDGKQHSLDAPVTWQTNQSAIATINTQGMVAGVGVGVAQVSASCQGMTGATSVTVGAPSLLSITVNPSQSTLPAGESEQLSAVGNYSDGSAQSLTQSVNWSSASAIANVSSAGTVLANAAGSTTISASSGSVSGTASLTVTPAVVTVLNVIPATLSMILESSRQFQAVATLSDGTTQDMTANVAWSSTQPAIVSVSNGGLAIAQQVGSTTVLAQGNGLTGSAALVVTPLLAVTYFDRANDVNAGYDGTVRLTNPGLTTGDLCAMVYVFDSSQEMNECCGCSISDSGLRTLSLISDLTANPLTGKIPQAGTIMVVSSNPGTGGVCDASSSSPNGLILGWGSNAQVLPDSTVQVTETGFSLSPLGSEATVLANECSFIEQLGSGNGICTCGTGN